MNECQRSVLQRHMKQLANDLMVTDDLLGDLYQHRIFDRHMIGMIKGQMTDTERVYKLLEILPRRGPHAFDTFINAIQETYPWLAAMLESSYQAEASRYSQPVKNEKYHTVTDSVPHVTNRLDDLEIKKRVGTFVHKQFGQSKRISQNDKKAVERFLNDQLAEERSRLRLLNIESSDSLPDAETPSDDSNTSDVQQRLFEIHIFLEPHLEGQKKDFPSLPEDMSFDILRQEINEILNRLKEVNKEVKRCMDISGLNDQNNDETLSEYMEKLIEKTDDQEDMIQSQKTQMKGLQTELNEYSVHVGKLESERDNSRKKIDMLAKEVSTLRHDRFRLVEKCEQLERIHQQHIEKEKTLENLKSVVKDLQNSRISQNKGMKDESLNVTGQSRELSVTRNSVRRSQYRTTFDRLARTTSKPSINYQMTKARYTLSKSGTKKKTNPPVSKQN